MTKGKTWILAVVVLAAAAVGLYLVRRLRTVEQATTISGTGSSDQAGQASSGDTSNGTSTDASSPEASGKAALHLRTPQRLGNGQIKVPLHFTAAKGEKVGNIHAELEISAGSWVFQDGSAPDGAQWSLTAEKASPDADSGEKKTANVIDLDIDGNGHGIRNGLIGFLTFQLQEDSKAQSDAALKNVPATVANLETWPPEASTSGDGSRASDADKPDQVTSGPLNPALGCFFFTH